MPDKSPVALLTGGSGVLGRATVLALTARRRLDPHLPFSRSEAEKVVAAVV